MNRNFLDDNFLLLNPMAERLYHSYAKDLPIIDYHNHLPPQEIAADKQFATITEVWLQGDHYKWRAMRANGVAEHFITGDASDEEKFQQWAATVPYTLRNPLYHWTHLELQRYFGIQDLLSPDTATPIYQQTTSALQQPEYAVSNLLQKMKVEVVCTTDDPTDDLAFHRMHQNTGSSLRMLPTFRPDKFLVVNGNDFLTSIEKLAAVTNSSITTFSQLLAALENRVDFFQEHGCQLADHGLSQLFPIDWQAVNLDAILQKAKDRQNITSTESEAFQMAALYELAKMYHQRGWTMQLHLGPLRNNNSRLLKTVGADVGCDSIGDFSQAEGLAAFLDRLDAEEKLTKTILYNLNPRDNEVFATMAGNYNEGPVAGKIQWGSAWWFLDQKDGMEKQLNTLSNMGLLSRFIGMLTDSRSFLSFPRHEYFRRILCQLLGEDVQQGLLPDDEKWLGSVVEAICYRNAKQFFGF